MPEKNLSIANKTFVDPDPTLDQQPVVIELQDVSCRLYDELNFGPISFALDKGQSALVTVADVDALLCLMATCLAKKQPDAGHLFWWGQGAPPPQDTWGRYAFNRQIAAVTRTSQLIGHLTLLENLLLSYQYAKDDQALEKAKKMVERFDLIKYENVRASRLPEQKRRMALFALEFTKEPGLLVAERPRQFLDADFDFFWDFILKAAMRRGLATIFFERSGSHFAPGDFDLVVNFPVNTL